MIRKFANIPLTSDRRWMTVLFVIASYMYVCNNGIFVLVLFKIVKIPQPAIRTIVLKH